MSIDGEQSVQWEISEEEARDVICGHFLDRSSQRYQIARAVSEAMDSLCAIADPMAKTTMVRLLADPDWEIATQAARQLGKYGDHQANDALLAALTWNLEAGFREFLRPFGVAPGSVHQPQT